MKVCAHYSLGAFSRHHDKFDSIKDGIAAFRNALDGFYGSLDGILDRTGEEYRPSISFYPACNHCNSEMCFHEWEMARYSIGPRGGIRKENV